MKFIIITIFFLFFLTLEGCTSILLLHTTSVVSKSNLDNRSIGTQINDRIVEAKVLNILKKNRISEMKARIIPIVYRGKIFLIGQSSLKLSEYIKRIIIEEEKTYEIYNEIRDNYPLSMKEILIDSFITMKIYFHLFVNKIIIFNNIKIITENQEVFLIGSVKKNQSNSIIRIISNIPKVKHIIVAFDYY